ncbi:CidA/LrgA family protein [Paraglaciecola aestuariivivens]
MAFSLKACSKAILGLLWLLVFWGLGLGLSQVIALPPALLGLLLLFATLLVLGRVPQPLMLVSQFCLRHLSLFFIAPLLAAGYYFEQLADRWWLFAVAIAFSTFLSLLLTAWLAKKMRVGALPQATSQKSKHD